MQNIPNRFRAQYTDRFMNSVRGTGEVMIQMELVFKSRLDVDRLTKAFDLTLDAEPILGCRFVKRWWRPYWERIDTNNRSVLAFTDDADIYERFKNSPVDPCIGPQIKACLLRTPDMDHLLMKVAHEVADAGAVKQIAKVVSYTYSALAHDPEYRPKPNIDGDRSLWQLLRYVPWYAYPTILYDYYRVYMFPCLFPFASIHLPVVADDDRTLEYVNRAVPEDLLKLIIEYGHQRNATLNDILMSALLHAISAASDWDHKSQLRLRITVDLRRFKPDSNGGGVCNLGGMEVINLGTDLNDDFDYTLKRISSFMRQRKARWIGINDYVGLAPLTILFPHRLMEKLMFLAMQSVMNMGMDPYVLANGGAIEAKDVVFDTMPIKARLLPTVDYPPHIVFAFTTYNGSLNISAGSWPCSKRPIERCLDEMVTVLSKLSSVRARDTEYVS